MPLLNHYRLTVIVTIVASLFVLAKAEAAPEANLPSALIVGTKHVPPFAIRNADGSWDGISVELWREVADELKLGFEFRELNLEELLNGLSTRSIDVAVAALTVTSQREQTMDFTHPFHTSGLGIAVSYKSRAGWLVVLERFISLTFLKVVLALAAVLFVAGFLVWVFERKHNAEQFGGETSRGLGASFWWSAVTMTTVGYGDKAPRTMGGRTVALVWMFTSVIIISSFTAAITSALTVTQLELKLQGPEDLPRVKVATVRGSTSEEYLGKHGLSFRAYDTPIDGLRAVATGEMDAMVYDAPILKYVVHRQFSGMLHVLPQVFEKQHYAIGLQEASTLREQINRVLVQKTAEVQWQETLSKYLGD